MTDWNQYARDVQAASNAAHNKDQKRIKELESKLAKAVEELVKEKTALNNLFNATYNKHVAEIIAVEAKLTKAVEALVQLERIVGDILGAHLQDHESRDKAIDLIKTALAELEK